MSILSATILIFLILDPFGNIPVFLFVLKSVDHRRHKRVIIRELIIALAILIVFLFFGQYILQILQVSQSSLGIAGGIILFIIALKMIFPASEEHFTGKTEEEPIVVPLAIPLIAGPSAMAAVILLMARDPSRWFDWLLSLIFAWSATGIILLLADQLIRLLGKKVLIAGERLMGMLLTIIAVEMLVRGIRESFF